MNCALTKIYSIVFLFTWCKLVTSHSGPHQESDPWWTEGQKVLDEAINKLPKCGPAKNVIMFLGDGFGIPTVTATRIRKGQKKGNTGEEEKLAFEDFPYTALIKTYNTDAQVPDSAGTATAFLCGVKTKYGVLGLSDNVEDYGSCSTTPGTEVKCMAEWAQERGKSTGFVTTTRVTHASPAALYAHSADRYWEASGPEGCDDVTKQLVRNSPGHNINVVLGGGRRSFYPNTTADIEYPNYKGYRYDDVDLVSEWEEKQASLQRNYAYVWNYTDFSAIEPASTDYLLGLFEHSHLQYVVDTPPHNAGNPSLEEMTEKAIQILQKNNEGYFLFVEGGRIDLAHHTGRAIAALEEALEFDNAISKALDMTSENDTLILVTADHSHVMTINGYPDRGNDILGLAGIGDDGLAYTTLSYANGPGAVFTIVNGSRTDPAQHDTSDVNYLQQATVPLWSETHGGEDVAVWARGPMSHLLTGTHEQNYIAHVMGYAACIGPNKDLCEAGPTGVCSIYAPSQASTCATNKIFLLGTMILFALKEFIFNE